jgi:hypothetical protein
MLLLDRISNGAEQRFRSGFGGRTLDGLRDEIVTARGGIEHGRSFLSSDQVLEVARMRGGSSKGDGEGSSGGEHGSLQG